MTTISVVSGCVNRVTICIGIFYFAVLWSGGDGDGGGVGDSDGGGGCGGGTVVCLY